jgi:L-ascorbate metabolism protein UlaG (beta-lactamase superfamily)
LYPNLTYTKRIIEKGKGRKRLTDKLQKLVVAVANALAEAVPPGTHVEVNGAELIPFRGYLGITWDRKTLNTAFTDLEEPGKTFYHQGDTNYPMEVASRKDFLFFANNLPEIVKAFEAAQDKENQALHAAIENLKQYFRAVD